MNSENFNSHTIEYIWINHSHLSIISYNIFICCLERTCDRAPLLSRTFGDFSTWRGEENITSLLSYIQTKEERDNVKWLTKNTPNSGTRINNSYSNNENEYMCDIHFVCLTVTHKYNIYVLHTSFPIPSPVVDIRL